MQRTPKPVIEEVPPEPEPIEESIEEYVEEYEPEPAEEIPTIQIPVIPQNSIPENKSLPTQPQADNGVLAKVLEKLLFPTQTRKTIKRDENGLITEILEERL